MAPNKFRTKQRGAQYLNVSISEALSTVSLDPNNRLSNLFACCVPPIDQRQVVLEGVFPATKDSMMTFLKRLGLRPKVELVGREIVISADTSRMSDKKLKNDFFQFVKTQFVKTPVSTQLPSKIDVLESSSGELADISTEASKLVICPPKKALSELHSTSDHRAFYDGYGDGEETYELCPVVMESRVEVPPLSASSVMSCNETVSNMSTEESKMEETNIKPDTKLCDSSVANEGNSKAKKKKIRVWKHLKRLFTKSSKPPSTEVEEVTVLENCKSGEYGLSRQTEKEQEVEESGRENGDNTSQGNSSVSNHEGVDVKHSVGQTNLKPRLDKVSESISLPVVNKKAIANGKPPKNSDLPQEISKSTTKAVGGDEKNSKGFSVVGRSAAIRIEGRRVRLEGKDVEYGTLFHRDRCFDKHFEILNNAGLHDIEDQVQGVKRRIDVVKANTRAPHSKTLDLNSVLWPNEVSENTANPNKRKLDERFSSFVNVACLTDKRKRNPVQTPTTRLDC